MRLILFLVAAISAMAADPSGRRRSNSKPFSPAPGDWSGWVRDAVNSRLQPQPGLTAREVPKLKLKWALGFSGETRAVEQPAVVGGRVFTGSYRGSVYSLDAAAGCIYWTYARERLLAPRSPLSAQETDGSRSLATPRALRTPSTRKLGN